MKTSSAPTQNPPRAESVRAFQRRVRRFYSRQARQFPWRSTSDPYQILVSEIMLQQTQTERVRLYFTRFLKRFPDFKSLASAPLRAVLKEWQGLGYNRRAKHLWELAQTVMKRSDRSLPSTREELERLPGIGSYTAAALEVFAFGGSSPMIETNIRRVYLKEFFPKSTKVSDRELLQHIATTTPKRNVRTWFYALMDYGAQLPKVEKGINKRSKHYRRQSRFEGSARQVRGIILRLLLAKPSLALHELKSARVLRGRQISQPLRQLVAEGLVVKRGKMLAIPT